MPDSATPEAAVSTAGPTGLARISHQIWDMKYRLKAADGSPLDGTIEDTWRRVARAAAAAERDAAGWAERFYQALDGFKFLPAGRIVAGAGTARSVTLFNCFVMGTVPDDMGGIFQHLREAALTLQQGGGIGYDFSTIRPQGAPVHGVAADASGPLSFMDVWDSMCRTIMSAGSRRGAMMATLRCDHPDIEAFVDAKRDPKRLRMFNLSVLITDAFMAALERDGEWALRFGERVWRTIRARDLWDRIMRATYDVAEPGVIFIDRINQRNNLYYCETISATNPCGEQPLPPYGACLLGSINLAALVVRPLEADAYLDEAALADLVPVAVRLLDNVIDISRFPLPAQAAEAEAKRRIGLGLTGLADALAALGLRYGTPEAATAAARWMAAIERAAYLASAALAAEKGAFPLFEAERFLAGATVSGLDPEIREAIARNGIRNALLTSIAPTGTISILADNVSSGIEPIFNLTYDRAILMPDGSRRVEPVSDWAYRRFRAIHGAEAPLPPALVTVADLVPEDHLAMQAAIQVHVDSSISKTINLPADIPFEAFQSVYRRAYAEGCKGCTTYRPNDITGSVLSAPGGAIPTQSQTETPLLRPEALPGRTYKLRWPESDHAIYITLNDLEQGGRRRPFEVFINSKNMDHYAWTVGLTRMISAVFRRGGDVAFVVEELQAVFDPRGGAWMPGPEGRARYVPSLLAAIGNVIERHLVEIGFIPAPGAGIASVDPAAAASPAAEIVVSGTEGMRAGACPRCGNFSLIRQEGCVQCTHCGYNKCG